MRDIRLLRLTLDNFKGCRHFVLAPEGADCTVYGDNAAGKTTLYDGLTWLLFGKDSRGQGEFSIKPLGKDGQVLDHAAITVVEAVLRADNDEVALRRTYYEKWSTRRGSAEERFDGHASDFFVDGVPVKKYEFEERVAALVDEELFRTLTGAAWFCSGLDWRRRRAILFELARVEEDGAIMAGVPAFEPLASAMGKLGLEDFRKKLLAERKGYLGVRGDVPVRLDECKKTVEELQGINFEAVRRERDSLAAAREEAAEGLRRMNGDAFLDSRRNDRDRLRNELAALERENAAWRREREERRRVAARSVQERAALENQFLRLSEERRSNLSRALECDGRVEACREAWRAADSRAFDGAICPVCGRPLEGKALEAAEAGFRRKKERELEEIVAESRRHKKEAEECRSRAEAAANEAAALEGRIAALRAGAEEPPGEAEDLPGYAKRRDKLRGGIRDAEEIIARHEAGSAGARAEAAVRVQALEGELRGLEELLAKRAVLDFTRERMDALRAEAAAAAEKLEELDRLLFLCDEFVRHKTGRIEEGVNSRFSLVRWKLFSEQVNGGLSECCEATVDGVPYGSLNSGGRVNAGIDVIGALSAHYGVRVPLVIDNAETVTALRSLDAQVIRLAVSEADKELRCEYGA